MKQTVQKLLLVAVLFAFSACDLVKQAQGAFNMTQCKYAYNSVSNLTLSNVDLANPNVLTLLPAVTSILTGNASSIPMGFTVNLNVTNPNKSEAMLNGLEYILKIDGVQFSTGSMSKSLNIAAGGTGTMPLSLSFDIASLLKSDSKNAVQNVVKNFVGLGSEKSQVSLSIKPTLKVAGRDVAASYIPIEFSFGGKSSSSATSTNQTDTKKSTVSDGAAKKSTVSDGNAAKKASDGAAKKSAAGK